MGPRPHLQHGRQPARLVHLAPARLGRADPGGRLREVRRGASSRRRSSSETAAVFDKYGADAWYERPIEEFVPPGLTCPTCGGTSVRARDEHPRRLVRLRLEPRGGAVGPARADLAGRHLPRRQRPASRLVPELAARRPRHARPAAVQARSLTHGFLVDEDGKKMSKSLGNSIVPQDVIKQSGADILRLWVVDERLHAGNPPRQGNPRARRRGLPQDPQHAALPARRTSTTSIRRPIASPRAQLEEVDRYILARYADVGAADPARLRGVRLRHDLPGAERVRDRRPERVLRRRLEGPALHVRARGRASGARRRRRCT